MKSFQERNHAVIAVVGLVTMVLAFFAAFNAESLPVIGGGTTYSAYFGEAGGLKAGNQVRIAGVRVGKVTHISLDKDKVKVDFQVKDAWMGDQTTAAIKIKTMLGQKFLALNPGGSAKLDPSQPIPLKRTTTPYDVNAALSDLSTTVTEIDTARMAKGFAVLADTFKNTPKSVRTMVDGLSALSRTVSSRDAQLQALLKNTSDVTGTLASSNADFGRLIDDGDLLLAELAKRRDAVGKMLAGTASLGVQLQGLVKDNEKALAPALAKLDKVSKILSVNQDHLERAVKMLGPYYSMVTSSMGNGAWLDAYVCGLFDANHAPVLKNDVARNCAPAHGGRK